QVVDEFTASCLMGTGQFCTNPGLVVLLASPESELFIADVAARFKAAPVGTLLSGGVAQSLGLAIERLRQAGAEVVTGGSPGGGTGYSFANTLLRVYAARFLQEPETLQGE